MIWNEPFSVEERNSDGFFLMEHPGTRRFNRTTNSYAVQGKKRSVSRISSILNLNIRIAYIVMIQFRSTYFLFISHFSDLIGSDHLSLFLRAFQERDSTALLQNKKAYLFDSIHELAYYTMSILELFIIYI